jgi:hypothetical protein
VAGKFRRVKVWSAVAIAASLAAAAVAWMAPAKAANVDQWRIAWKSSSPTMLNSVAAPGPREAWAVGESPCPAKPCVLHWNGKTWSSVSIPGASGFEAEWVGASSATNVLVFGFRNGQVGAFRYDGQWSWVSAPSDISPLDGNTMLVVGTGNAWATNNGGSVVHWNGSTWKQATVHADLTSIDGSVKKGLWAVGTYQDFVHGLLTMYHLVGSNWVSVRMPHPQTFAVTPAIAVESPTSIWIAAAPPGTQINHTGGRIYLTHWNGRAWSRVNAPNDVTAFGTPTPDGHGGVWLGTLAYWTGHAWIDADFVPPPPGAHTSYTAGPNTMVKVPGTAGSYWGAGDEQIDTNPMRPAMWLYGPRP